MSDFISDFWSHYVAIVTVVSILACLLLLWVTARKRPPAGAAPSDNTTGHVWDEDLTEMNNPLPRWWMGLFIITIVFSLGYLVFYPGLGKFAGQYGWTTAGSYADEVAKANKELEPIYSGYAKLPADQLVRDPKAMAIGERLFMNNCSQCHGSDAHGSKGFPNLTDDDWIHGGEPAKIEETITKGRTGMMPSQVDSVGSAEDIRNVANYVLSLANEPHDSLRASLGKPKFAVCAACHGADGAGNQMMGAPRLNDRIWLHGYGQDAIIAMVTNGKTNVMPAQKDKLTPQQIHVLAAYVWGLSHKPGSAKP